MRSPDAEARQLARILLDAQEHGMIAAHTLRALRVLPPSACKISAFTLDEARRWCNIPAAIFEAEHARWFSIQRIIHGGGRSGARPNAGPGGTTGSGGRSLTRSEPR